jgi:urease accessory protein
MSRLSGAGTQLLIYQLADSAFPSGGFAHSWGLEAACQMGEVTGVDALRAFLRDAIVQAAHGSLPLATAVHREPGRLAELDALCDAFLTTTVANRASRIQGRSMLSTCARVWGDRFRALERESRDLCAHHAPIFGAALHVLEIPLETAQELFLHGTVRGVLAASVRLGIAGAYAAQQLQAECAAHVEATLARCRQLDDADLTQTAPLVDLFQSAHDRLYSRLFQS